jgi:hypothetical protein
MSEILLRFFEFDRWENLQTLRSFKTLTNPPDRAVALIAQKFRNKLSDVALHVAFHGVYHRGQIAALVRARRRARVYRLHSGREDGSS